MLHISLFQITQEFSKIYFEVNKASQSAAEMMTDETDIPVETPLPILPEPIDAGIILGIVLTIIGGVIWMLTCYIVITRSPRKKEC